MPDDTLGKGSGHGRVPGLDGLRGLAVLLVVLAHANIPIVRYGGIAGVALFFVLSGFLITTLLVRERRRFGHVSLRSFYARRALRLLPALVVAIAGGVVLAIAVGSDPVTMAKDGLASLFYLGNFRDQLGLYGGPFAHLWTLAMEEQFYLLWPLVIVATGSWRRADVARVALAIAGISLVVRFGVGIDQRPGYRIAYYSPQTNVYGLLLGSAAALWISQRRRRVEFPSWFWWGSLVMYLGVATVPGMKNGLREINDSSTLVTRIAAGPAAAVFGLGLVLAVATSNPALPGWLTSRVMLFLGNISYGLYLWHEILDWTIGHKLGSTGMRGLVVGSCSAVLAVGAAVLSKRYVEDPFLRRKQRFERTALPGTSASEDAGVRR
ncbi:MAG TPA: acyltransferase [Microthrixaceae bacterium]|jgi:peptidoglycan/LPS O-acetylase OafA/YrhL|nr:acyltransferase [Microthrixaceae bacterium]HMT25638.1 acyltransferase [Microthrixaceae bacterium]